MNIRAVNLKTKKETSRPLTQEEIDASVANTARESMKVAANIDTSDDDLQSDIADANSWPELQAALLGNGPKGAKVKGRK